MRGRHRIVTSLSALLLSGAAAACGGAEPVDGDVAKRPRLLILGWDGATYRMIEPLIEAGGLPNLTALIERGSSSVLRSTVVPISSAAWTAAMTGKNPAQTGVYSFFEPLENSYDVRLISSRSNRAAPLWRIATRHGLPVRVFGVPVTYPPEPVLGTMVSGMLSPADAEYSYPPELAGRLRERGFVPDLGIWMEIRPLSWEGIETQLRIKRGALLEQLQGPDWRLGVVVFKSLDVLCHRHGDWSPGGKVWKLYRRLDEILGELLSAAGPDTDVIVMSDHGFRLYPFGIDLEAWMIESGFSVARADNETGSAGRGPLGERRAAEHRQRLDRLDLSRTRAYAGVCEGNFCGIRLNVAGREPAGIVPPERIDALLAELSAALEGWRPEAEGPGPVRNTVRGDALYSGPYSALVPDLLVEFDENVQARTASGAEAYSAFELPVPDHDVHGVLVAAGPSFARRDGRGDASILDVTPTALHLLGLPVYSEMSGRVLAELLREPAPVRLVAEEDDPAARAGPDAGEPYSEEQQDELRERLRALGYVD